MRSRVLIATIRDQGNCPCVRCLVTTSQISALGTPEDRTLRQTQPRVESKKRQQLVKDARDKLYREGYVITGDKVYGVLKDESLVPTLVCVLSINWSLLPLSNLDPRIHSPSFYHRLVLISFSHSRLIYFMSLSLACGRPSLSI